MSADAWNLVRWVLIMGSAILASRVLCSVLSSGL